MRENVKYILTKYARRGAAISLLIIIGFIVLYFVQRRQGPLRIPEEETTKDEAAGTTVDRKEGVEYVLFRKEKGKIKVRAKRFYVGMDKLNHLEGNVEVVDYGQKGGRETFISADRIDYDQDLTRFTIKGGATIKEKDAVIESSSFDYDKNLELFMTDQGVVFSSSRLTARSQKLAYWRKPEKIELEGNLALEVRPKMKTDGPLIVSGDYLLYKRNEKTGRVGGNVKIAHGKSRGTAGILTFFLAKNEDQIKGLILKRTAQVTFFEEGRPGRSPSEQRIEAEEIRLLDFPGESRVCRVKALGDCFMTLSVSSERKDQIRGRAVTLTFDREGGLKDLSVQSDAQLIIGGEKGEGERRIRGPEIRYNKKTDHLWADAKAGIPARISSLRTEIEAQRVMIKLGTRDMQASGDVKLVLKPDKESQVIGFFSKEKPVFTSCQDLSYTKMKQLFLFNEGVRVWQDKDVILAKEFSIFEDSGEIYARGNVHADFKHTPNTPRSNPQEERLTIDAAEMSYVPSGKQIVFKGPCILRTSAIVLTSESLALRLKESGGEMDRLFAAGKVVITQESKEGRGENADYDLISDVIVLTGSPVLVDKEKGTTAGDKLTFHLSDDKIVIENKERGRSATVIKS